MNDKDLTMTEKEIAIAKITFTFGMTESEAKAVLHKPNGQISRKLKSYMWSLLKEAASRFFDKDINLCKDSRQKG